MQVYICMYAVRAVYLMLRRFVYVHDRIHTHRLRNSNTISVAGIMAFRRSLLRNELISTFFIDDADRMFRYVPANPSFAHQPQKVKLCHDKPNQQNSL